jgi:isoleucyl-tRNA synthetase
LNVKEIGTVDDPRLVAKLEAKPNFRALGPRFGKQAPVAAALISAMDPEKILELRSLGRVVLEFEGQPAEFTFEEIKILEEGVPPYVATGENGLTVALDTTLTDDLRQEGLCREIINKVQNLRKKSGLEVSDRIELSIRGEDTVQTAVTRFADRIQTETLAQSIASDGDFVYKDTFTIDENEIDIALGKV